ncbi:MAG: hypothetical protein OHK0046_39980 [Anaerolineae bacterium]
MTVKGINTLLVNRFSGVGFAVIPIPRDDFIHVGGLRLAHVEIVGNQCGSPSLTLYQQVVGAPPAEVKRRGQVPGKIQNMAWVRDDEEINLGSADEFFAAFATSGGC